MAYVALYRKYRSQSFGELMGQEAVTTVLQNALKSRRIAHAYLFHGARGCGKTSTARLLAKALNCISQDGPVSEPCGECRLCTSIRDGSCMDVVEMDAASETGIDDVREKIIENVQYAPGEARYKVYIIDEVHDLSAKAFDALLKTLEEPPAHVVFILATTELQKVPITIRSRCQLHTFKRGTLQDLATSIQRVVSTENYTAEPEAILSIARCAEGSWRDALSLLEQVLAYSDGHISMETVHRAIGTVGAEKLSRVTETLACGQDAEVLSIAAELVDSGTDVRQLLTALYLHLRDLMLITAGAKQLAIQELGQDRFALMAPQAAFFSTDVLLTMMGLLSEADRQLRFNNQHRAILECTLLRLMPVHLERSAKGSRSGVGEQASKEEGVARRESPISQPLTATPTIIPKPPSPTASFVAPRYATEEPETEPDETPEESVGSAVREVAEPNPTVSPDNPTPQPANTEHRFAEGVTLQVVQRAWSRILKYIEKASPSGLSYLQKAEVIGLVGQTIHLEFKEAFARDRIQNKGREMVEKAINKTLNEEGYKIQCFLAGQREKDSPVGSPAKSIATPPVALPPEFSMGLLLDAPVTPTAGPTRIADFEMPPPPPTDFSLRERQEPVVTVAPPALPPIPQAAPVSTSLLDETLDIFGGEVIRTEPLS